MSAEFEAKRAAILAEATRIHDEQGCTCDRKYLLTCSRLQRAILGLAAGVNLP
jgi:hypothetical protein